MSLINFKVKVFARTITILLLLMIISVTFSSRGLTKAAQANSLEYYQISSNQPGPTIIITGGIHGNEPAGYRAAERLLDYQVDKGTVYIFPQVNKIGINNTERLFKDGKDLNRSFLAKEELPSVQLADQLLAFIENKEVNLVLDLHESKKCAKIDKNHVGQTLITSDHFWFTAREVAEEINQTIAKDEHKFRAEISPVTGSLVWAVSKELDIPGVTVETCMTLDLAERVEHHFKIVSYFLQEEGVNLYENSEEVEKVKKVITY